MGARPNTKFETNIDNGQSANSVTYWARREWYVTQNMYGQSPAELFLLLYLVLYPKQMVDFVFNVANVVQFYEHLPTRPEIILVPFENLVFLTRL